MKVLFFIALLLQTLSAVYGQSQIPVNTRACCYSSGDCSSGTYDNMRSNLFTDMTMIQINHCCFDGDLSTPRASADSLSFTLNDGNCQSCDDESVQNMAQAFCFSTCDAGTNTGTDAGTNDNTLSMGGNDCCDGTSQMLGYGADTTTCAPCQMIGTGDPTVACDPHFFLPLANGDHICFSVQGQPDFAFNLIKDKYIQLNAQFVLPAKDESHTIANVSTFLGDLGLVIRDPDNGNVTVIKVSAIDHSVLVGNSLTLVKDKPVHVDIFKTVSINIDDHLQTNKLRDESAWLYINTDGFGIKVRFYKKHLDMFLTKTNGLTKEAHGLIGQFLTADVKIDTENMLLKLGNREPIPVKMDKAWPFLGINEECWYGRTIDDREPEIIEGTYIQYVVNDLIEI